MILVRIQGTKRLISENDFVEHWTSAPLENKKKTFVTNSNLILQCKAGNGCYRPNTTWRENRLQNVATEDGLEGKSVEAFGVKSLEHHVANLTFLESK